MMKVNTGDYAVIHLGKVVFNAGHDRGLVRELREVHQSFEEIESLFSQVRNQVVPIFSPDEK